MATFQGEAWIRRQKDSGLYEFKHNRDLCPEDPDLPSCWPRTANRWLCLHLHNWETILVGLGRTTDWSKWKPSKGNHESVFGRQDLQPVK